MYLDVHLHKLTIIYVHFFADVNDLQKFVSVALHTSAGEGDYSHDQLSQLKTIGNGFGPLIYGLKEDSSFESFRQNCEAVWSAVKDIQGLPQLLVMKNVSVHVFALIPCVEFPIPISM